MQIFKYPQVSMTTLYEAEIADGLAAISTNELQALIGSEGSIYKQRRTNEIPFTYSGDSRHLFQLQTVFAVYAVVRLPVPRPKALLGHQYFQQMISRIQDIMALSGRDSYQSLHISAAGSDSSVMNRIKMELSQALNLAIAADEGDLLLRIRPTPKAKNSWDVLIRLSPRPLATRSWRICNMEGALNAAVASSMVRMTKPTPQDTFLNIACGSGTILIERAAYGSAQQIIGCDIRPDALSCAATNIHASAYQGIQILHADAATLPLLDNSVDVLCADLPFGQLVGTHQENEWLYPALMTEAARVARPNARFVIITHEVRLMDGILAVLKSWQVREIQMITLGGLHPRIYVLERSS
jgi:tRNA (guanine6-N2)-methyltransferase